MGSACEINDMIWRSEVDAAIAGQGIRRLAAREPGSGIACGGGAGRTEGLKGGGGRRARGEVDRAERTPRWLGRREFDRGGLPSRPRAGSRQRSGKEPLTPGQKPAYDLWSRVKHGREDAERGHGVCSFCRYVSFSSSKCGRGPFLGAFFEEISKFPALAIRARGRRGQSRFRGRNRRERAASSWSGGSMPRF